MRHQDENPTDENLTNQISETLLPDNSEPKIFNSMAAKFAVSGVFLLGALAILAFYQNKITGQTNVITEAKATDTMPQNQQSKVEIKSLTVADSEIVKNSETYQKNCAECHGEKGEGKKKFPELTGVTTREDDKLSDEDLIGIMNDPNEYGLSSKMPSFRDKLSEDEKRGIVQFIKTLK